MSRPGQPIRVLLVEDNEVYRNSLELLLGMDPTIEIVGAAAEAESALELAATTAPDVALVDYRLPGLDGAAATAALLGVSPVLAVVCLTAEVSPEERDAVIAAGASDLVEKGEPIERLIRAVREAAGQ